MENRYTSKRGKKYSVSRWFEEIETENMLAVQMVDEQTSSVILSEAVTI